MEQAEMILKIDEIEIYDNDFDAAIADACEKFDIEDLTAAGQRQWKRVMAFVGKKIFSNNKILRDRNTVWLEGNNIPTNNNRFDYSILNILCDYYMSLSDQYNKLISAEAFSLFINIPRETIWTWKDDESSTPRFNIYKKLKDFRLECIKDNAFDNGNVTGTMYVGNVEYGTNLPGVRQDEGRKRALTDAELPRFGTSQTMQIAQKADNLDSENQDIVADG